MSKSVVLRSTEDKSINMVRDTDDGGYIETRFVQRQDDTAIIYLSSSSGCNKSCRMCHLTQTGQTMDDGVSAEGYIDQARRMIYLLRDEGKLDGVKIVHYNFMARGDALSNPYFIFDFELIIEGLSRLVTPFGIEPKFKISTIFPNDMIFSSDQNGLKLWLESKVFPRTEDIEFYYSLYSLDLKFRKRWLPKSIDPEIVGTVFSGRKTGLRLHHALISGENDGYRDVIGITAWLARHQIKCGMNIVRYNPFDEKCGTESSQEALFKYAEVMSQIPYITHFQVVSRVGRDVKASCGLFVTEIEEVA